MCYCCAPAPAQPWLPRRSPEQAKLANLICALSLGWPAHTTYAARTSAYPSRREWGVAPKLPY
eukprot:4650107-Pleurochrysis_carterae.AAC.1